MIVLSLPVLLTTLLLVSAIGGNHLVDSAAPVFMRMPRTAVIMLMGIAVFWLLGVTAIALMLAWLLTGPAVLPTPVANVCQRCLDAANPFTTFAGLETMLPVAVLLAVPVAAFLVWPTWLVLVSWQRRKTLTRFVDSLALPARPMTIGEHQVLVVSDSRPLAFSLPRRLGGIVVSDTLCEGLEPDELSAVLYHEQAHVNGRHHLAVALVEGVILPLRRIPLFASISRAIPQYLEIAADVKAKRKAGTPALAKALLKLGERQDMAVDHYVSASAVMHAAGPDRIGHLIAPASMRFALLPLSVLGVLFVSFAAVVYAVHGPYLYVILTGCGIA